MLGIPYRETKIEENSRDSVRNHSAEENITRNFLPWNKNTSKLSEFCSKAFRGRKQETFVLDHFLKARQPKISGKNSLRKDYICGTDKSFC
jgi:hypothetical protein